MELRFHMADYIIMGAFLLISLAIGIFYGIIRKQRTTEEYLLGNRRMHLFPVALSMCVTYQSAISVIGVPAEIYIYDSMFLYIYFGVSIATIIQYSMIGPLVYPLRLTSAYEYLGQRYDSRATQLMGTFLGMFQTLLYMSIVLLAPALALEAVVGIPLWISIVLVGIIGTVYTSLGGIKSVVWTDVFQCVILFAGLLVIIVLSWIRIGSFESIWSSSVNGKRIVFDNIAVDPRVRHTIWSLVIGGAFNWLPNCCNQSAVQRICSMKSLKQAKIAILLNAPLNLFYGVLVCFTGIVMFAYFAKNGCDPLAEGVVTNGNQITPYFVMHVLSDPPGLAGLFVAALFSGALSSLSSGINAMAANTIEDVLVNYLRKTSQWTQALAAKLTVVLYGAVAVTLAYLAKDLPGPITQIALSAMGAVGGPVVGMMFLGAIFPQANWVGAIGGGIIGLGINIWISVCSVLYGTKPLESPSIGTYGCKLNHTQEVNVTESFTKNWLKSTVVPEINITDATSGTSSSNHLGLYDMSYLYFGMIGILITIIVGISISFATGADSHKTEPKYIFPCMRRLWKAKLEGLQSDPTSQVYRMQSMGKDSVANISTVIATCLKGKSHGHDDNASLVSQEEKIDVTTKNDLA